nr:MAG TPA: hypothetical protein [Caudoviricetes sp.]
MVIYQPSPKTILTFSINHFLLLIPRLARDFLCAAYSE